ncbi:MAG TPA: cytidine deaminase [bacterium]|nr:cytidine deaminase [bacterium]
MDSDRDLFEIAKRALGNAYAPYSRFRVGAAVLTREGNVYSGCNVENSSYGLTVCAERNAVFKAISEGARAFDTLALVSESSHPVSPCGACLQVLSEFTPALRILLCTPDGIRRTTTLSELLPDAFGPDDLPR